MKKTFLLLSLALAVAPAFAAEAQCRKACTTPTPSWSRADYIQLTYAIGGQHDRIRHNLDVMEQLMAEHYPTYFYEQIIPVNLSPPDDVAQAIYNQQIDADNIALRQEALILKIIEIRNGSSKTGDR